MKKGQVLEGVIKEVVFPNKGIVEVENETKTVIVKNGVPGQKVRFSINKIRKGKCEGRLLEVIEKSPVEVEPSCPHFGICGGCTYQNLDYPTQLAMKEKQVKDLVDSVCQNYEFEGIKGSPRQFAYRNKMEFSFGDEVKDGPLALGMHKRGSFYDIVTVDQCEIVDDDYNKILACVLEYFKETDLSFYHKLSHQGYLRHLLVRKGQKTGEILIDLVTSTQSVPSLEGLKDRLLELELEGRIVGLLNTLNDSLADVVQNDETKILYGQDYFYEELLGLKFKISPFSFFQTNSLGAEVLYETARSYVGETKDKVIFDLYSGTGTIAQMLAPVAKKVIGIEIVEEAVEAAKVNAALNNLDNCEFIAGDVLKAIDLVKEKPDLIVLDPPRDGIHPKALLKIIDFGVDRMVYISCKPTSLVRDLEVLQGRGYEVVKVVGVDMFPGTGHVETVVLLSHKKPDSVINVKVEFGEGEDKVPLGEIAKKAEAYKPKERVTYKMIKEYIEEKYGFKVHTSYIAEVKRSLGLPMYDAPNAVEELKHERKHPTPEKVEAIKDALKYFGVI
ncbi:23S rRNA (uracil(1939)-C(5))-methyltransferase RlmD [Robinsoniella peoriensis]|uniref:23S rRNA (Uracil-C(5))-methyltransferase RlmCD n=1 Tax=Robinsoniella peoriensis TaxID=180332 RepID=A0A4U8PZ31_9FIRM|nr:23S rRNA (uracil(1939)-C(5))-methyltransferase RlmD [Robinsoniella peoriensis]MDU7029365.1 23S rRNA (uracil(1939)-C(5))-methyltransferase RlmD [Clostridiales bacterium]TLC97634.1 23S rRNA (uracil-C(5))-methyltransferase RlmCD [Robinsoniella peoriensis]